MHRFENPLQAVSRRPQDFAGKYVERQQLRRLNEMAVKDIGRYRVEHELKRPFWYPPLEQRR
jgi:uncharacterized protein YjiS (DUF1127 family)